MEYYLQYSSYIGIICGHRRGIYQKVFLTKAGMFQKESYLQS